MATKKTNTKPAAKPANNIRAKAADVQGKFKNVAIKAADVAKGNAVVVVASTKALTGGLKKIGAQNASNGRKAVQVLAADFKAIAKVKSLPELVRLQGEQTARTIEAVKATTSSNVADVRELVSKKVAPLVSAQFKANLDLFRKAA